MMMAGGTPEAHGETGAAAEVLKEASLVFSSVLYLQVLLFQRRLD